MKDLNSEKPSILNQIFNIIFKTNNSYLKIVKNLKLPSIFKKKYSLVILLLILFIFIFASTGSSVDTNIPVFNVKKDVFLISITESGEIKAKNSISIAAPRVRGSLKIVELVPEGNYVKPGDVVARFDPTEALVKLKDAEAQLEISRSNKAKLEANHQSEMAQMESDLKSAELSFELSKLSLEQMKFEAEAKRREAELQHNKNVLNFEKTKQNFESKKIIQKSEMENMNVEIRQKISELEKAQRDLDALSLTSSADGLVVYGMNWSTGLKFQIGDQPWSGQVIVNLPDLSQMESHTYVNEVDVSKVKVGQKVEVKLDAFQDSVFVGEVSNVARLGKQKDNQSTIKVFDVFVEIKGVSEILKPGMTTSNKIIIDKIDDQIFIPHEALFENEGEFFVYKKDGSGFDDIDVTIGNKSEDFIVVKSGLEDGDVVALRDPNKEIANENLVENNSVQMPENGN
ncbi:MAG: efflux RND transporter periplasmic adaptor subunit [Ignavibacteriae bacterium]|nr:efflux RND transporter periplasmic adaptor subunit [Ignavibacteriota bacterium]